MERGCKSVEREIHGFDSGFILGEGPMTGFMGARIRFLTGSSHGLLRKPAARVTRDRADFSRQRAVQTATAMAMAMAIHWLNLAGQCRLGEEAPPGGPAKDANNVEGDASEAGFHGFSLPFLRKAGGM